MTRRGNAHKGVWLTSMVLMAGGCATTPPVDPAPPVTPPSPEAAETPPPPSTTAPTGPVAAAEAAVPAAPVEPEATSIVVERLVDVVPELAVAVHLDASRLRRDEALYSALRERVLSSAKGEESAGYVEFLLEHLGRAIVGVKAGGGRAATFMALQTEGRGIVDESGAVLGVAVARGSDGFLRGRASDVEILVVNDSTALAFGRALAGEVDAILEGRSGPRLEASTTYTALARDVGFGEAPLSFLGALAPAELAGAFDQVPPQFMPLVQALNTVERFGGHLKVGANAELYTLLEGRNSSAVGILGGTILFLKSAVVQTKPDPRLVEIARGLQIEPRGEALEVSCSMSREMLVAVVSQLFKRARDFDAKAHGPTGAR